MASNDMVVSTVGGPGDPDRNFLQRFNAAPPPMAAPPGEPEDEAINWSRYLSAFRRYGWLMALVVFLGTAGGIVATRFMQPTYTVNATVWVEHGEAATGGPLRPAELLSADNWIDLLRSGAVLDSVVVQQRLFLSPAQAADSALFADFAVGDRYVFGSFTLVVSADGESWSLRQGKMEVAHGAAGAPIGANLGWTWVPSRTLLGKGRAIQFSVHQARDVTNQINGNLVATLPENGNFIRISLDGTNPSNLAPVLNDVCHQFVTVAAEFKRRKVTEYRVALDSQVSQAQNSLRQAESRLRTFQVQTITQPRNNQVLIQPGLVATQPAATQQYFTQKGNLEAIRSDREQLESVLARTRQGGSYTTDAFLTIAAVKAAPQLSAALSDLTKAENEYAADLRRYTPEHPLMVTLKGQIDQLRKVQIPALAQGLIDQLKSQEKELAGRIQTAGNELKEVPTTTITEMRLQREYDAANDLYKMLAGRLEEARLAELGAVPDIRILESAVAPTRPSRNSAPRIILVALVASIGLAMALALALDHLDHRFRYPEQVTNELGLAILGAVPACRKNRAGEIAPEEAQQVLEAFRTIRLNLAHSYGVAGPVTLTVSSPGAGDGKSFVSSNLAVSFAQAGYRTLLIDGDIRRGELHRMFGVDRRPGVLDYLTGSASHEDIVRPTNQSGLWIVPCGSRRHHGPELLGSAAMSSLMAWFKSRFNVIILDSPPLGAGIDPFVLGTMTGHLILVFRAGETDRQMAQAKLPLFERLPVRVLGAVLNEVEAGGVYRYYNYIYGYTSDEEPTAGQLTAGAGGSGESESS